MNIERARIPLIQRVTLAKIVHANLVLPRTRALCAPLVLSRRRGGLSQPCA